MFVEGAKEQQAGAASARSILCWILTAISVVTTGLHWISDVAEFIANCRIRGMRIRAAPHKMDSVFEGSFDNKPHADEGKQDHLVRPPRLEEE
ncbi:transmembrane protein, putative [Bodo saltans]|uniref:Transmembrane protein, putative n=1 Tax=Bodo saltans TaxID=75058 RepID=A0A0S4J9P3_BODSA|nr:transmembrane protein, putative [Bodo saltans]|eukprot:CUG85026.1 transmembrane protein, putative [Bodo saltans]